MVPSFALAALAFVVAAAPAGAAPLPEDISRGVVAPQTTDGATIFRLTCSVCHGERGDARSFAAEQLNPKPRNFTDPLVARTLTRERMLEAVRHGRPESAMAAFGEQLSEAQIESVVDYVRSTFMRPGGAPAEPRSPPDDAFRRGRAVYEGHCYMCHGYSGNARTLAALALQPPPRDFTDARQMEGLTRAAMAQAVRKGKPGTAMQPFEGILSAAEVDSVVAFIERAFVEKRGPRATYHSVDNDWVDFDLKYRTAILYFLHPGDDADLSAALLSGKQTFEVACVTCHVSRERAAPPLWRRVEK